MSETYEWLDAAGTAYTFDHATARVLKGVEGRFMPPVELLEQQVPQQPGALLRGVKTNVREVTLPVVFIQSSETALRTSLRQWASRFDPTQGDGAIRITDPAGALRRLPCRYSEGLSLSEAGETNGRWWQKAVLVFRAQSVYWLAETNTEVVFSTSTDAPTPFFPFFPMHLLTSELFRTVSVTNGGDVDAWPVWTLEGPADEPLVVRNDTTGKKIEISRTLGAAETITIDTTPRVKTVTLQDGTNLYPLLTSDSELFSLIPGVNVISAAFGGITADTDVVLDFRQRYLTA